MSNKSGSNLSILIKFVRNDIVDRKYYFDIISIRLRHELWDFVRSYNIKQRIADLREEAIGAAG